MTGLLCLFTIKNRLENPAGIWAGFGTKTF